MLSLEFPNSNPLCIVIALTNALVIHMFICHNSSHSFLILQVLWCACDLQWQALALLCVDF